MTLVLQPLLRQVPQSLDIAFKVNGRAIAAARAGDRVPVQAAIAAGGEALLVTELTKENGRFTVQINNNEPNRGGRVLPRFPNHGTPAALTDDLGNTYALVGAHTNFNKADPVTMWAGGSSFAFAGEVPENAKLLKLHVEEYGLQLRGPWETVIQVPLN